jgi:hypothetical protein
VTASRYNFRMTEEQLAAKVAMHKKLASLSFSEKIKILEKLRDRDKAIAAAGLQKKLSKILATTANNDKK